MAIAFSFVGGFKWYKTGNIIDIFEIACVGLLIGLIIWLIQFLRYNDIEYEISSESIVKRRGKTVKRLVNLNDIEYYFFQEPTKYPILKIKNDKKFEFTMTMDSEDIVKALISVGIEEKP